MALVFQARRLAAEYRDEPLQTDREVSDVLAKLAADHERMWTALLDVLSTSSISPQAEALDKIVVIAKAAIFSDEGSEEF